VRTIIADEASMIDHVLFWDLLYYGIPVLFVGDHGQLEPIGTNPGIMAAPTLRLEQIHRQALGNPILRLATAFREGRRTPPWEDPKGRLSVLKKYAFDGLISPDVQAICGFNRTRHGVNRRVRQMMGVGHTLVAPGEKLICLKNNRDWNIFNGQQVIVLDVIDRRRISIDLEVQTDDGRILTLTCLCEQFGRDPIKGFWEQDIALMDYGYCLTAHKAQGSEWDNVLVVEEIIDKWDARRWRYTAATRAKERLVYCA
jgi:exodeoxyribonuclease-5